MLLPQYPVYIPSKGRSEKSFTARFLIQDGVPFYLVVEPQDYKAYAAHFAHEPLCTILTLPENDRGLVYVRNWIMDHSIQRGDVRHWQLDDNIRYVRRWYKGKRIRCASGPAFHIIETFVDRYTNVAIAGMNYNMFAVAKLPPFQLNHHVYSCSLFLNSIPQRWRGHYNDDTDICLQVLAGGWCTVLVNVFLVEKLATMTVKGGMGYEKNRDSRAVATRELERNWPGVVRLNRRFGRPQHIVYDSWNRFDNQLILKPGVDLAALPKVDEFGLELTQIAPEIKSATLRQWVAKVTAEDS